MAGALWCRRTPRLRVSAPDGSAPLHRMLNLDKIAHYKRCDPMRTVSCTWRLASAELPVRDGAALRSPGILEVR